MSAQRAVVFVAAMITSYLEIVHVLRNRPNGVVGYHVSLTTSCSADKVLSSILNLVSIFQSFALQNKLPRQLLTWDSLLILLSRVFAHFFMSGHKEGVVAYCWCMKCGAWIMK